MAVQGRSAAWVWVFAIIDCVQLVVCISTPIHPGNPRIGPPWVALCAVLALVLQIPILMLLSHLRYRRNQRAEEGQ